MSSSKEVAAPAAQMPAFMNPQSTRGSEEVGTEDMVIPRLGLVQAMSKILKKSEGNYNPDADVGDFYNTATNQVLGNEVKIIPVMFVKEFIVWKDQSKGGGFFGAFPTKALAEAEKIRLVKDEGEKDVDLEVVDTAQHYCLLVNEDGSTEQIVCSMDKSKMKASRTLNTLCQLRGGDRFCSYYIFTSVEEKNKAGQEYMNIKVEVEKQDGGYVTEEHYRLAEQLYDAVKSGEKTVERDQE